MLTRVLLEPEQFTRLPARDQDELLRYASRANLVATLGEHLAALALSEDVQDRFRAACVVSDEHARRLRWEVAQLLPVLRKLGIPVIALKGAAYLLADLPSARGRLVSDLDLLVARPDLATVEQAMLAAGYLLQKRTAYDQHYYREWMHEIPPLIHPARKMTVDLHHNIAPPVSRLKIDATLLIAAAVPLDNAPGLARLSNTDMVLHLCVHMFHDGELNNSLRELLDLDAMLRKFATTAAFWPALCARAVQLGLTRPLYYGLHFCSTLLQTAIPAPTILLIEQYAPMQPGRCVIERCMRSAILPESGERAGIWRTLATQILFLRSHWLRMPPGLLIRHLFTQIRRRGGIKTAQAASQGGPDAA